MKTTRFESASPDKIIGFVAAIEWVNDSATIITEEHYSSNYSWVWVEDHDADGAHEEINLDEEEE